MSGLIFVSSVMGLYCLVYAFTRRQRCRWIFASLLCFSAVPALNWTDELVKESCSLAHREGSEASRTGSSVGANDDQSREEDGTNLTPEVGVLD